MRIVSVTVENFRAIERLRLSFVDGLGRVRQISVIAGPNGSGKTSLLFAITNALRGATGYKTADVPVPTQDDIRTPKTYRAGWADARPETRVDLELQLDDKELEAIPKLMRVIGKEAPAAPPNGRITLHWWYPPGFDDTGNPRAWYFVDVEPRTKHIRSWLSARSWAIRAWTRKTPGMQYEILRDIGGIWFFPQDRNLRERVIGEDVGPVSRGLAGPEDTVDDDRELDRPTRRERTVSEVLHFLSDYAKNRASPLPDDRNWEKRIQEIFHRVCLPKRYVGYLYREENPPGAPILQSGEAAYPLSHAASGEQVILEYATRMTYPTPLDRSIILIDEPEIHLHPSWIRQLYLALPQLGEENQYLLTTHSPELRQRSAADNALIDLGKLDEAQ